MMSRKTPNSKRTCLRQAIRQFLIGEDGESGASLVEFTLFAPILVVMCIYMVDFGLLLFANMEVQNAAQAGVDWAIANRVYNCTAIKNAAIKADPNAAANATKLTISAGTCPATDATTDPIERCGCPSSTGVTFTTFSGGACPTCGSSVGGHYVTVTAQARYNSFIPYGLISPNYTITKQSTARIQ
jgi:Flp pilus assembly protein TadG